ncbi:MAG TPA: hypothetical protein VKP88_01760 [Candidatus Paceibacterota bacterium]|nr:hypothetical protein [Candidatus Paceibacterota bacterium]
MATLLDGVTTDTVGTGASHTGPCSVFVTGTPDGATVTIEVSPTTNTADYVKADRSLINCAVFRNQTGSSVVDGQGTYYVRALLSGAGDSTDVTVTTTQ